MITTTEFKSLLTNVCAPDALLLQLPHRPISDENLCKANLIFQSLVNQLKK